MNKLLFLSIIWFSTLSLYAKIIDVQKVQKETVNSTTQIRQTGSGLKNSSSASISPEISVTSEVITPKADNPNESDTPLNVNMVFNPLTNSHAPYGTYTSCILRFHSSDLQIPLRFSYKLKDPSWKSKMTLAYGNNLNDINKKFEFDDDGIAWMDADGSKIENDQIYHYIKLEPSVCGVMEYEIAVYDETQTQVYATFDCEASIVNPILLPYNQEIKGGTKETDIPFSLNVSNCGDFNGKDLKVRMELYTDLPPETFTLNYINEGKPDTIILSRPNRNSPLLQGEHLISSFSSTNGNYTIKSMKDIWSAQLDIKFIDQSNNKSIPYSTCFSVTIVNDLVITYPVSFNLQNIAARSAPNNVIKGESLYTQLTPMTNYNLPGTITVTMGGRTLTAGSDYDYFFDNGYIKIPSVTGEVVITAKGIQKETFAYKDLIFETYNSSEVTVIGPNLPEGTGRKNWAVTSCVIPATVTYNNQTYTVRKISLKAFNECYSLLSIEIPGSVTNIEYMAFGDCITLTNLKMNEGVSRIEAKAFLSCWELRNVTFPASISFLGDGLFEACETTLTEIHCLGKNPVAHNWLFKTNDMDGDGKPDCGPATCKLYVPKGSKAVYAACWGWKAFVNIIEESDVANDSLEESDNHVFVRDGIVYIEVPAQTEAQIINYSGQVIRKLNLPAGQTSINGLNKGMYIIKYAGNKTAKVSVF